MGDEAKLALSKRICSPFDTQSVRSLARASTRCAYENASLRVPAACRKVTRTCPGLGIRLRRRV